MKTTKPPRQLLRKSHAHKSGKDYKRQTPAQENTWRNEAEGCPHLHEIDYDNLPDKAGVSE